VILNAITERFDAPMRGRHFEAWLIIQTVSWFLAYRLSSWNNGEMFLERGFDGDQGAVNRWVLAYTILNREGFAFFVAYSIATRFPLKKPLSKSMANGAICIGPPISMAIPWTPG
jgi:hypothetical protein